MSITGNSGRSRRRGGTTIVVVETPAAAVSPALAAQQRKASEPQVEELGRKVDGKAPSSHSHAQADVTGLVAALAAISINTCEVDVDFGATETEDASLVVTGQAWVTANSKIVASLCGGTTDHPEGDEDALIEGVRLQVVSRVAGVGFTVLAHAPEGTSGAYRVHIHGVG